MVDNWKTLSDNSPLMTQSRPPFLTVTFPNYSETSCFLLSSIRFFCHRQPYAYLITLFDVNVTAFCNVFWWCFKNKRFKFRQKSNSIHYFLSNYELVIGSRKSLFRLLQFSRMVSCLLLIGILAALLPISLLWVQEYFSMMEKNSHCFLEIATAATYSLTRTPPTSFSDFSLCVRQSFTRHSPQ